MKNASDIVPSNPEEQRLRDFDLREIDAPDQRSHFALKYVIRLEAVLEQIRARTPAGGTVLEVGAAQANASLLLAQSGYTAVAVDLNPDSLGYARKKHEQGDLHAVCANAECLPLRPESCDAIYVGELVEHCADPVQVLRAIATCLRKGGLMVITTPNAERSGCNEPTYSQARNGPTAKAQYGPGGEDHLFAFTPRELEQVVTEAGLQVVHVGRHATTLHSDRFTLLKRIIAPSFLRQISRAACALPWLRENTSITLIVSAIK